MGKQDKKCEDAEVPVIQTERMQTEEVKDSFKRELYRKLEKHNLKELAAVEEVWRVSKEEISRLKYRRLYGLKKRAVGVKGSTWWNEKVRRAVKMKRQTYPDWLSSG